MSVWLTSIFERNQGRISRQEPGGRGRPACYTAVLPLTRNSLYSQELQQKPGRELLADLPSG